MSREELWNNYLEHCPKQAIPFMEIIDRLDEVLQLLRAEGKSKMDGAQQKSVFQINEERKNHGAKFEDYQIGDRVKIVCACQDFRFFNGQAGIVIKNTGKYLGLIVAINEHDSWGFNPEDLKLIQPETNTNIQEKTEGDT